MADAVVAWVFSEAGAHQRDATRRVELEVKSLQKRNVWMKRRYGDVWW